MCGDAAAAIGASSVLLVNLEVPIEAVLAAARIAKRAGAKVVLDPAWSWTNRRQAIAAFVSLHISMSFTALLAAYRDARARV